MLIPASTLAASLLLGMLAHWQAAAAVSAFTLLAAVAYVACGWGLAHGIRAASERLDGALPAVAGDARRRAA